MLYIQRNSQGQVVSLHESPHENATEAATANDQEVVAFLTEHTSEGTSKTYLARTDIEMIRVLEDLVELLIENNQIRLTDLPPAAQEKLLNRKQIRTKVGGSSQLLIDEDELL